MISRHFFRAKVLQTLYAAHYSKYTVVQANQLLENQIKSFNCLAVWQISALIMTREAAEQVLVDFSKKFNPTKDDLNPSRRFVDNPILLHLADNNDFRSQMKKYAVHWDDTELFRRLFITFKNSPIYIDYVKSETLSFEEDKNFILNLFKFLMNDNILRDTFFERAISWEDDFDQMAQYSYMTLRSIPEDFNEATNFYQMNDSRVDSDIEAYKFAMQLLDNAIEMYDESVELIKKHLNGWEFERVAVMDVLLLDMAIAELVRCESIPERVTIDEYIELSKEFSTERSKLFINGILDRMLSELRAAGRVVKTGRGIYDPDMLDGEAENFGDVYSEK
ncbi:MAG: transcription antitermination protein NusB [Bacteroidales bacterium]|nr:transcription antitermination protein NusB [Bacteroidales bacterium]